jgi:hypothetical protein
MFFYRNKHIMIDLGTGNNNKVRRLAAQQFSFTPAARGLLTWRWP